jgi:hypothetical protein
MQFQRALEGNSRLARFFFFDCLKIRFPPQNLTPLARAIGKPLNPGMTAPPSEAT